MLQGSNRGLCLGPRLQSNSLALSTQEVISLPPGRSASVLEQGPRLPSSLEWKEERKRKPASVSAPAVLPTWAFCTSNQRNHLHLFSWVVKGHLLNALGPWDPVGLSVPGVWQKISLLSPLLSGYYGCPSGRSLNQVICKVPPYSNTL